MTKYRSRKVNMHGVTFDSAKEARRWGELLLLQKAGVISGLVRQFPIVLAPGVQLHGKTRTQPALRLVVDFVYTENGARVYEDAKGFETPESRIKRHIAKAVHNIDVMLV